MHSNQSATNTASNSNGAGYTSGAAHSQLKWRSARPALAHGGNGDVGVIRTAHQEAVRGSSEVVSTQGLLLPGQAETGPQLLSTLADSQPTLLPPQHSVLSKHESDAASRLAPATTEQGRSESQRAEIQRTTQLGDSNPFGGNQPPACAPPEGSPILTPPTEPRGPAAGSSEPSRLPLGFGSDGGTGKPSLPPVPRNDLPPPSDTTRSRPPEKSNDARSKNVMNEDCEQGKRRPFSTALKRDDGAADFEHPTCFDRRLTV